MVPLQVDLAGNVVAADIHFDIDWLPRQLFRGSGVVALAREEVIGAEYPRAPVWPFHADTRTT
jgi:hypothetical protein